MAGKEKKIKEGKCNLFQENPIPENSYFSLLTLKSPSVITRGKRKIITREERKLQFSALMFIINKKDFLKGIGNYKN